MIKVIVLLLAITVSERHMSGAQQTRQEKEAAKEAAVTKMIQGRTYVFMVQSVLPMRGGLRQLSQGYYDVRVTADSVISFLPYFGRAYTAPLLSDGGIKFTSTKFDYAVTERKKGGWNITIKPADATDVRQLFFIIFPNGSASLQVISTNRQPISFNGYVVARK